MIGLLVIKDLVENSMAKKRRVPIDAHAGIHSDERDAHDRRVQVFQGKCRQTAKEAEQGEHQQHLRQQHSRRRKER